MLASLVIDYEFDGATLTSATSWYDRETDRILDLPTATVAVADIFGIPRELIPFLFPNGSIEVDDTATETLYAGGAAGFDTDGPLEWLIGGFYRKRDNFVSAQVDMDDLPVLTGGALAPDIFDIFHDSTFKHVALFGEATYHLSERSRLTGGLRLFRETITSDATLDIPILGTGVIPSTTRTEEEDLQFKRAYAFDITDDAMVMPAIPKGSGPAASTFDCFTRRARTFRFDTAGTTKSAPRPPGVERAVS